MGEFEDLLLLKALMVGSLKRGRSLTTKPFSRARMRRSSENRQIRISGM
jgi:hypothetical protein